MQALDFRVFISVLPISITVTMVGMPVIGVLNGILEFINKPNLDLYISTYLSLPFLIIVFVILSSNFLVSRYSVKSLLMIALYLYIVSGLGSYYANNEVSLMFFRCLTGIAAGIILPLSTGVISIFYDGEKRFRALRYFTVLSVASGIFMLLVSAFLSMFSWRFIFFIYILAVIPFLTVAIFFPDKELKEKMLANKALQKSSKKHKNNQVSLADINFSAWRVILKYFLISIVSFFFLGNMGFYIKQHGLGSNTVLFTAQSFYLLGSFVSSFILIYVQKFFKADIYFVYSLLISIGCLTIWYFAPSIWLLVAISFLIGYGYGGIGLFFNNYIIHLLPANARVLGVSLNYSAMFLGQFAMPFVALYIKNLFNIESLLELYSIMGALGVLLSFISVLDILFLKLKNNK